MGNEINSNNLGISNLGSTRNDKVGSSSNEKHNPVEVETKKKTEMTSESVSMTEFNRLNKISEDLSRLPEVDNVKVEKIKQAIAEGLFEIDPEKIAQSLIDFAESNKADQS